MTSRFKCVENGTFLGRLEIPTQIYEWQMPEPNRFGDFQVRLVVPLDGYPRRFYVEPVLRAAVDPIGQAAFLGRACEHGYKILRELEEHDASIATAYGMYAAVFRNRHAGHLRIARKFASSQDFVDFSGANGQPSLILPGLGDGDLTGNFDSHRHRSVTAHHMLKSAIAGATDGELKTASVIRFFQSTICEELRTGAANNAASRITLGLNKLPHRSDIDLLFANGVVRNSVDFNWPATMAAARQSLIGGPCSNADFGRVDLDAYSDCTARVVKRYQERTPSQFDQWLLNVREHRFLQLIKGGIRLQSYEREQAETVGRAMFCMLLWDSYQHMARCYGSLMLLIWLHLAMDEEMGTDLIEEEIFKRFHLPQMYLGGLPLDFLTPHQLPWIIGPLQQLWSECRFDAESYDPITKLLAVFGVLVRDRRAADRKAKAFKDRPEDSLASPWVEDAEHVLNARPFTGSRDCPTCGRQLALDRVIRSDSSKIVFATLCERCEREFAFVCDPSELGSFTES